MQSFADGATEGFVVFSLGSNVQVSTMPENIKQMFVSAFARLPPKVRVFWKWEKDNLKESDGLSDNVKIVSWLPQQDLLGIQTLC